MAADQGGVNPDNSGCLLLLLCFIAGQLFAIAWHLSDLVRAIEHLAK